MIRIIKISKKNKTSGIFRGIFFGVALLNPSLPAFGGSASMQDVGAPFGLQSEDDAYVINTGAGLDFRVRRAPTGVSLRGAGDISSLRYHGVDYQDIHRGSHINSGFGGLYDDQGPVDVEARTIGNDIIEITVHAGELIHYYIVRRGEPRIYMATWFSREPKPGLVRFIVRVPWEDLPHGPEAANLHGTDRTIEAHDIFGRPDGQTRSKHYSNMRLKDWRYFGATGPRVGLWIVRDDNEGNSGGPFYRSLLDQGTSDQELTYIINYGEGQTEPFRTGILNCYTLVFTNGEAPGHVETSWFTDLDIKGYVAPAGRGAVEGVANGLDPAFTYTIGLANAHAQYWTAVAPNGHFTRPALLPGTYRLTLYKNELAVAQEEVTVEAGRMVSAAALHADDPESLPSFWRIGHWDGSPREFLNGDKVTTMHPSDIRMAHWAVAPFIVGQSVPAHDFPAYQWQDINNDLHIHFMLDKLPASDLVLRIGITTASFHGRPVISLNEWDAHPPKPSLQPTSRTLTVGTYRGNNVTYRFTIPASAFKAGPNDLALHVISGNRGHGFLSPGVSYDAIDLVEDK